MEILGQVLGVWYSGCSYICCIVCMLGLIERFVVSFKFLSVTFDFFQLYCQPSWSYPDSVLYLLDIYDIYSLPFFCFLSIHTFLFDIIWQAVHNEYQRMSHGTTWLPWKLPPVSYVTLQFHLWDVILCKSRGTRQKDRSFGTSRVCLQILWQKTELLV